MEVENYKSKLQGLYGINEQQSHPNPEESSKRYRGNYADAEGQIFLKSNETSDKKSKPNDGEVISLTRIIHKHC